jgi:hypothetical protein
MDRKPVGIAFASGSEQPLLGSGNQGRFVRLESSAMLDRREIEALLAHAIDESETPLPPSGRGRIVIKAVSAKGRARKRS